MNFGDLWDIQNPLHVLTYSRKEFVPSVENNAQELAYAVSDLFGHHRGLRLTGAVSIYTQIPQKRAIHDIDVCIDESAFVDIAETAFNRGYYLCRLAYRELNQGLRTCVFEQISPHEFLERKPSVRTVFLRHDYTNDHLTPETLIDIFVRYTDSDNWERTYDHRLGPILPTHLFSDIFVSVQEKNVRSVPLLYMAMIKNILIIEEEKFGEGNKLDRKKNAFDLENILALALNFKEYISELMKQRKQGR